VLGNLVSVALPNTKTISYVVDAENHRIGKRVNGSLVEGFLYDGDAIVAQLNGANQIVSQFVYGTGSTSPYYMVRGGVTYRIFSDELGSPLLIVNTSTGSVAEQITFDEFGNVISDSNPGFQSFGFAGGLYDQDTKLVRFGGRDYNPSIGRWTARDPILFEGGDTNLFGYVLSDPVNMVDRTGLDAWDDCSACKSEAKKAGSKIVRMELKTFGKSEAEQTQAIQRGMVKATTNPSIREYKKLEEQTEKRSDDSVDPFSRWLRKVWRTCTNAL
jgi:RHS repeat-associated protein